MEIATETRMKVAATEMIMVRCTMVTSLFHKYVRRTKPNLMENRPLGNGNMGDENGTSNGNMNTGDDNGEENGKLLCIHLICLRKSISQVTKD